MPDKKPTSLEAVLEMRKRGLSLAEIGKLTGTSKQNISQLLQRSGVNVEVVETYRKDKNLIFNAKQKILVDALTPKIVSKMSGRDLLVGAGILQDKIRDLENPARGGIGAGLWINIVAASHQPPEKDVTPTVEVEV